MRVLPVVREKPSEMALKLVEIADRELGNIGFIKALPQDRQWVTINIFTDELGINPDNRYAKLKKEDVYYLIETAKESGWADVQQHSYGDQHYGPDFDDNNPRYCFKFTFILE